jgi:hypothetical protein
VLHKYTAPWIAWVEYLRSKRTVRVPSSPNSALKISSGNLVVRDSYLFDKKTTTGECLGVDVRFLHREGLLKPRRWFSLRWSRASRETGSIRCVVEGN